MAGDDLLVIIGRHDDVAVLADQLLGDGQPLARSQAHIDDLRAQRQRRGALDGRRVRGHHDNRLSADFARHIGHGLRMVAAGVSDDAAGDLAGSKLENLVGRAAHLEGADGLKTLRLEPDLLAGSVAGEAGEGSFDQRGFHGDLRDARSGGANGFEGDEVGHERNCTDVACLRQYAWSSLWTFLCAGPGVQGASFAKTALNW